MCQFLSWAFARSPGCAKFRVRPVSVLLGFGLVLALVRDFRVRGALVALLGKDDQAHGLELGQDALDPLGLLVVHRAGQRPGDRQDAAASVTRSPSGPGG